MKQQEETKVIYSELKDEKKLDPDLLDQIDKDIKRTFFPGYHLAKEVTEEEEKQRLLLENEQQRLQTRSILIAYAAYDKTIGYVQGFNSIVAALLYCFHLAKEEIEKTGSKSKLKLNLNLNEEEVFYTFLGLMTIVGWREKFLSGMDDIAKMCDDFKERMEEEDKVLYKKFFSNGV